MNNFIDEVFSIVGPNLAWKSEPFRDMALTIRNNYSEIRLHEHRTLIVSLRQDSAMYLVDTINSAFFLAQSSESISGLYPDADFFRYENGDRVGLYNQKVLPTSTYMGLVINPNVTRTMGDEEIKLQLDMTRRFQDGKPYLYLKKPEYIDVMASRFQNRHLEWSADLRSLIESIITSEVAGLRTGLSKECSVNSVIGNMRHAVRTGDLSFPKNVTGGKK